jgi:hypothetical protein
MASKIIKYRNKWLHDLAKIWKVDPDGMSKYCGIDMTQMVIPAGAILPMSNAAIYGTPSGWSVYNPGNFLYKYIRGSTSSGTIGDYTDWANISIPNNTGGSHPGSLTHIMGTLSQYMGLTDDPGHQHTMTLASPFYPRYFARVFIQADSDTKFLPRYTNIMKYGSGGWTGLSRNAPTANAHLMPHTDEYEGTTTSKSLTVAAGGYHVHGGNLGLWAPGSGGRAYYGDTPGTHTHTVTATLTYNLYRQQMSMWYHTTAAGQAIGQYPGAIIMMETVTEPTGWSLCDGTNGTPNLNGYYLGVPSSDASAGAAVGAGTLAASGTTSSDGTHDHWNGGGR